jgi:hypothetical protein
MKERGCKERASRKADERKKLLRKEPQGKLMKERGCKEMASRKADERKKRSSKEISGMWCRYKSTQEFIICVQT